MSHALLKRVHATSIHMTAKEKEQMQSQAQKAGLPLSVYLRQAGLKRQLKAKCTAEEINLFRQLAGMANNLNQIAKALNTDPLSDPAKRLLQRLLKDIQLFYDH